MLNSTPNFDNSRDALTFVYALLSKHYGVRLVRLILLIKSLNEYLPKDKYVSDEKIATAMYGKKSDRRQVFDLLKNYGAVAAEAGQTQPKEVK